MVFFTYRFNEVSFDSMHMYVQEHPWFKSLHWERLYQMKAAFIPTVKNELDTQNFEKFEEVSVLNLLIVNWSFFNLLRFSQ